MMGYDAWLERPYQDRYAMDDAIERAADDLDLSDDEFEAMDWDQYFSDLEDDAAIAAAEAAAEMDYDYDY